MWCKTCHYSLVSRAKLTENRCPACGTAFDPNNPRTYDGLSAQLAPLWQSLTRSVANPVVNVLLGVLIDPVVALYRATLTDADRTHALWVLVVLVLLLLAVLVLTV